MNDPKTLWIIGYLFLGAVLYGFTLNDADRVEVVLLLSYLGLWPFVLVAVIVAATLRTFGESRRKKQQ